MYQKQLLEINRKMKKNTLLLYVLLFITTQSFGQGTPSVKIFANYNADTESDFKEFEIKRSYLGYSYKFDDKFSAKITFDVGSNSGGSAYTSFLKIASVNWKASENMSLNFGMIGTKNFKFMEKSWGKRYVEKSALDQYKWASSADAGISGIYRVTEKIIVDAQLINGEGYKKSQTSDGVFRSGAGLTVKITDDISCRLFRDNLPTANDTLETQTITSGAINYIGSNYNVGLERNIMQNEDHITNSMNREILSLYGSINLAGYTMFLRRDMISTSNKNIIQSGDGSAQIFGIEKQITKGVKIALNFRSWEEETLSGNSMEDRSVFLNVECKF